MMQEIEIKLKVDGFAAVRKALRAAGAVYLATVLETDVFYDAPDRRLLGADCGLRIRRTRVLRSGCERVDVRPLVTYKGPRDLTRRFKTRAEVQTRVDDAEAIGLILEACGLRPCMTIQKRRASYRMKRCRVELDELPRLGRFVEIEGPDDRSIEAVRRALRLGGEAVAEPYVSMAAEYLRRAGKQRNRLTFAEGG